MLTARADSLGQTWLHRRGLEPLYLTSDKSSPHIGALLVQTLFLGMTRLPMKPLKPRQVPRRAPLQFFISDVSSVRDSLSLSGGTDEVLHSSDPSRPNPEVNGSVARAKTNPPTPMIFSIGSAQACSTSSVSKANTKRHRYFTRYSKRNNEG